MARCRQVLLKDAKSGVGTMRQRFDDTMRSAVTWLRRALPVTYYSDASHCAVSHVMAAPLDRLGGIAAARKSAGRNLLGLFSSFSSSSKLIHPLRRKLRLDANGLFGVQMGV